MSQSSKSFRLEHDLLHKRCAALVSLLALGLLAPAAEARNLLSADGPGETYELLRTAYTTELPDCGHMVPHITEEIDDDLGKNVFVFHAHVDRGRRSLRGHRPAADRDPGAGGRHRGPERRDRLLPLEVQAAHRLPDGSAASPTSFRSSRTWRAPIMTLTPRGATFGIDGRIGKHGTTDLVEVHRHLGGGRSEDPLQQRRPDRDDHPAAARPARCCSPTPATRTCGTTTPAATTPSSASTAAWTTAGDAARRAGALRRLLRLAGERRRMRRRRHPTPLRRRTPAHADRRRPPPRCIGHGWRRRCGWHGW